MRYIILILTTIVVTKSQSACDFDNKTVQLFLKKGHWIPKTVPLRSFLYYLKTKRKLEINLNLNHPNLNCGINEICKTNFSNFEKMDAACLYGLNGIRLNKSYSRLYYESGFLGCYSFCEMFFMFEHKTKFMFLVDHFELWLFSHRNFTIHSNQLTKKSGNSFLTKR